MIYLRRIDDRGRILLPRELLETLDVGAGDQVVLVVAARDRDGKPGAVIHRASAAEVTS